MLLTVHFRGGSMPAGEIAGRFAHAWPTTSRHLKVLEAAGLLEHEKVGRTVVYRISRARLAVLQEWLAWFGPLLSPEGNDEARSAPGIEERNPEE